MRTHGGPGLIERTRKKLLLRRVLSRVDETNEADDYRFVEFYTRAGCPISASLRRKLRRAGVRLRIHDIWADPHDAAFVRSVARGYETVPTVVVGDTTFVAPSARTVLSAIQDHDPSLVDVPQTPEGDRWYTRCLRRR